jgi:menaquinol-cytochrome c reductase iron-sulfur subunit
MSSEKDTPSRRTLVLATAAGACAIGAATVGPAIAFALAPVAGRSGGARWVKTLPLDQLKEGEPRRVAIVDDRRDAWTIERHVELGSVWLVRRGSEVVAYSAVCPHLGCSVNVSNDGFSCPCHTSAFDRGGRRTSGPSPRDLDPLATRIENGFVVVDFRRFRIGVADRVVEPA